MSSNIYPDTTKVTEFNSRLPRLLAVEFRDGSRQVRIGKYKDAFGEGSFQLTESDMLIMIDFLKNGGRHNDDR